MKTEAPFIQTIFSPLAQATPPGRARPAPVHLRRNPQQVHAGLETITQSTIAFIEACQPLGIAGIYYAVQWASFASTERGGVSHVRRAVRSAHPGGRRGLLVQYAPPTRRRCDVRSVAQYPVQAINWHDREVRAIAGRGMRRFRGRRVGGLEHWHDLLRAEPEQIEAQVADAIEQTGGQRLIVSSGCVAPSTRPSAT